MGSKEIFLRMREEDFNNFSPETRGVFTYIEVLETNEWEKHKNDPKYLALKKAEKKAKEDLKKYLFDKRHEKNNNIEQG